MSSNNPQTTPDEERVVSAKDLSTAWGKYHHYFAEVPHGTEKQMAALLEFIPKEKS